MSDPPADFRAFALATREACLQATDCVACPNPALVTYISQLGLVARLCEDCDVKYKQPRVYFIRGGERVKIGHSVNVAKRLRAHQIGSPVPLELWFAIYGDRSLERDLHRRFAADRDHGEWFRISDEIRDYVASCGEL